MNFERRLRKIETSLPPRKAARLWLTQAQRFPAYEDYLRKIDGELASLQRIPEQVAEAMEDRLKFEFSWPAEAKTKAIRQAREQTIFLMNLVFVVNNSLSEAMVRCGLLLWALQEQRWRMSQQKPGVDW